MLPDVQNSKAEIRIPLNKVGVKNVEKYIRITRRGCTYHLTARLNMFVRLGREQKGVNMSRFLDTINSVNPSVTGIEDYAKQIAEENKRRHEGAESYVEIWSKFPYPITKPDGHTEVRMWPLFTKYDTESPTYIIAIKAVGMSYCPCGKAMCGGPSHNQRSIIEIELEIPKNITIRAGELVEIANQSFSAPIYSSLKRPWEKYLIEQAMKNARFSEDECRVAVQLLKAKYSEFRHGTIYARVRVTNEESIHPHDCVAEWEGML